MVGISLAFHIALFVLPFCFSFHTPLFPPKRRIFSGGNSYGVSVHNSRKTGSGAFGSEVVHSRTHESLDFKYIVLELRKSCKTAPGASLCKTGTPSMDLTVVRNGYAMVNEMVPHLKSIPLRSRLDIQKLVDIINNNTAQPELVDLAEFAYAMDEVHAMHAYLSMNIASLPLFHVFTSPTSLSTNLTDTFNNSFRSGSQLNLLKYPILQQLHAEKEQHRVSIIASIKELLKSARWRDKVADGEYVELNGRYCILLKNTHRRGAGIVHGESNTGKTLYVEPVSIVEPTNELKRLESRYKQEEHRVLLAMCQSISAHLVEITAAVNAVAQIDVIAAKAKLGRRLNGIIPEVSNEGCIRCVNAKHPILLLRDQTYNDSEEGDRSDSNATNNTVVGNSFELNATMPALVISGPNTGGKTVVLKTAGLFALMVQHCIPLPVERGARVDLFPEVMADIGDLQSVSGDVSTFSGHLLVCREILHTANKLHQESRDRAEEKKHACGKERSHPEVTQQDRTTKRDGQCLVLLDEIGTGTDPEQGSALAQSVLERLVEMGARVMATTHYQRIKELAVQDTRFQVAAMEFDRNTPTYRMRIGSVGESYALEAARRLGLPEDILTRADALLDDNSRTLAGLQRHLLKETETARQLQQDCQHKQEALTKQEREIETARQFLQGKIEALRQGKTEEHLRDIKAKERELEELMDQAQQAIAKQLYEAATTNKKSASFASAAAADTHISSLQHSLKTSRVEIERKVISARSVGQQATPLADGESVEVGARLVVLDPNYLSYGTEVFVTSANKGKGRVCVRLAGHEVKMERHLLGVPIVSSLVGNIDADETQMTPKERRLHRDLLQVTNFSDEDLAEVARIEECKRHNVRVVPRTSENTLDVRDAHSYSEVQDQIRVFVREQQSKNKPKGKEKIIAGVFYILHGVNCAYKARLRTWLLTVEGLQHASPALLSVGGDAVTLIRLWE